MKLAVQKIICFPDSILRLDYLSHLTFKTFTPGHASIVPLIGSSDLEGLKNANRIFFSVATFLTILQKNIFFILTKQKKI